MRAVIPLRSRPLDVFLVGFFFFNLVFVSYNISFEQIAITDPYNFEYPFWPLPPVVDMVHWYGNSFDPPLMARPAWWRATIWIDVFLFGPFYAAAIFATIRGKEWIRIPSIIWGSVMMTNVTIILFEEIYGVHAATSTLAYVFMANASWLIVPVIVITRMWRNEHPFSREAGDIGETSGATA